MKKDTDELLRYYEAEILGLPKDDPLKIEVSTLLIELGLSLPLPPPEDYDGDSEGEENEPGRLTVATDKNEQADG